MKLRWLAHSFDRHRTVTIVLLICGIFGGSARAQAPYFSPPTVAPDFSPLPPVIEPQSPLTGMVFQDEEPEEKTADERIAELEEAVKKLSEPEDEPTEYPTLEIGGRIHFDSWWFADDSPGIGFFENPDTGADPEDRIYFRRIRLELQGKMSPTTIYRWQIDFNTPSEPEYKDVYIGFTDLPLFQQVIFGNHKRPLGLDHLNSSRYNIFMERPLVVEAFNEDARRIGASSQGSSKDEMYNWQYGVYLLENTTLDGEYVGDSLQASLNARFWSSPWYDETSDGRGYFHWAIAGMAADPDGDVSDVDSNANEARFRTRNEERSSMRWLDTGRIAGASSYEIAAVEAMFNAGPLQIVSEYQTNWTQRNDAPPGGGPDLFFHGGYVYVAYMLTGEHMPYNRRSGQLGRPVPFEDFFVVERCHGGIGSGWGAWQAALRYSHIDLSDDDIQGGVANDVTLALVWYFNAYTNLQFNAVYGMIDEHFPVGGYTDGEFVALGTRLRMEF
jgi:phosphate-selective porin OprO/OprP